MIALAVALALAAPAPKYAALDAAARDALLAKVRTGSVAEQLARVTAPFLGTPYAFSPLGEGSGVDADPRVRFDAVDCLTFVETSLALLAAPDAKNLLPVLDDIRYAAPPPAFENRNHFVEAQWVPNNLLKGWIRDITRQVSGGDTVVAAKTYTPERWKKRHELSDFPLDSDDIPRGTFKLDVAPLAFVAAHPEKVPSGTLAFVVREDFYSQPTRVTHVGFILDTPHGRVFRHASKEPFHRVVDEPLDHFLQRNAAYAKWKVVGFSLFEVRVPTARVAKLTGG